MRATGRTPAGEGKTTGAFRRHEAALSSFLVCLAEPRAPAAALRFVQKRRAPLRGSGGRLWSAARPFGHRVKQMPCQHRIAIEDAGVAAVGEPRHPVRAVASGRGVLVEPLWASHALVRHRRRPRATRPVTDWRKRVGVEPTRPGRTATPTDLKSARVTGPRALPGAIMSAVAGSLRPRREHRSRRREPRQQEAQRLEPTLEVPLERLRIGQPGVPQLEKGAFSPRHELE